MGTGTSLAATKEQATPRKRHPSNLVTKNQSCRTKVVNLNFNTLEEAKAAISAKYDCGQLIGRGGSADVYLMTHKISKKQYACKMIAQSGRLNKKRTMHMETYLLQHLQHDNLINLYEMYECPGGLWLMLEYANGGDLWHGLAQERNYSEATVSRYFKQILLGVKYLHEHQVMHRDLKLENVLVHYPTTIVTAAGKGRENEGSRECILKIADFGLSTRLTMASLPIHQAEAEEKYTEYSSKGKENAGLYKEFAARYERVKSEEELQYTNKDLQLLYQMWGTTVYFAPEIYDRAYGYQADIWSLGCMLYEMLTGELAFPEREDSMSGKNKKKSWLGGLAGKKTGRRCFEVQEQYSMLSAGARSLIQGMLHRNPKKRLHIEECLRHPFIVHGGCTYHTEYGSRLTTRTTTYLPQAHIAIQLHAFALTQYQEKLSREMEQKRSKANHEAALLQQQQQQRQQQQQQKQQQQYLLLQQRMTQEMHTPDSDSNTSTVVMVGATKQKKEEEEEEEEVVVVRAGEEAGAKEVSKRQHQQQEEEESSFMIMTAMTTLSMNSFDSLFGTSFSGGGAAAAMATVKTCQL